MFDDKAMDEIAATALRELHNELPVREVQMGGWIEVVLQDIPIPAPRFDRLSFGDIARCIEVETNCKAVSLVVV